MGCACSKPGAAAGGAAHSRARSPALPPGPTASLSSSRSLTAADLHPHTPREGDSAAVADARRVGRAVTAQWVAHHTQRAHAQAAEEEAHAEDLRAETQARAREEQEAHAAGVERLRAEEARVLGAHMARVAADAEIVHPREAREWPTEHVHVRALALLPAPAAAGSGSSAAASSRTPSPLQQQQQQPPLPRVASASDDALVRIFSLAQGADGWVAGACVAALAGHTDAVLCLAALPGQCLASGGKDGLVGLWDVAAPGGGGSGSAAASGRCLRMLAAHQGAVLALAALADGRLASAGQDGAVRLWLPEGHSSDAQATLWGHARHEDAGAVEGGRDDVCALAAVTLPPALGSSGSGSGSSRFASPGRAARAGSSARSGAPALASGGMDGVVLVWELGGAGGPGGGGAGGASGAGEPRARLRGHVTCINALVQLSDGRLAASARDGSVRLWDLGSGACTALSGHPSMVLCLAPHPDGQRLLSGSADGSVHVWEVAHPEVWSVALEPQVHGHKDGVWCLAVLGDGSVLSGGFGATVRVWDVEESHIKWRPEASPSPRGASRRGLVGASAAAELAAATAAAAEAAGRAPSPAPRALRSGSARALVSSGRTLVANPLSAVEPSEGASSSSSPGSFRFVTRA